MNELGTWDLRCVVSKSKHDLCSTTLNMTVTSGKQKENQQT